MLNVAVQVVINNFNRVVSLIVLAAGIPAAAIVVRPAIRQWLEGLPAHAPLRRWQRPALATALAAFALTLIAPRSWVVTATLVAVGLAAFTILIISDRHTVWRYAISASFAGLGVVAIGAGVSHLGSGHIVFGIVAIFVSLGGFGVAQEVLRPGEVGIMGIGLGVLGLGVASMEPAPDPLLAMLPVAGVGAAMLGAHVQFFPDEPIIELLSGIVTGGALVGLAVLLLVEDYHPALPAAMVGAGVAGIGLAVTNPRLTRLADRIWRRLKGDAS